ncbi:MAG: tail fiber domain-containing protein, partial [Bacteroidia bacterium]|nr:tail fiber domain-containing protein [Bacteroidia bacterium]
NNISGLRLTDLATATPLAANNKALSVDANGDVILVSGSGISNACATADYIPVTTAGGNLNCSQIYDDGTSVGIGTNTGFTYTWPGGLTGPTAPPGSGTVKLNVNGVSKAVAYFATSDQKFKREIKSIGNASEILSKLEGKTYFWKTEEYKGRGFSTLRQYGFIAQELEKVVPEAVATDENGDKCVNYDMIIPILVQNAKEQATEIRSLQKQLDELKETVKFLAGNTASGKKGSAASSVNLSDKNAIILNQNVPNPFAESTVVTYTIGQDFVKAQLIFTTTDGKVIKAVDIKEKGSGTLNVFANDLSSGLYSYSLIVDGKVIDTKKMIKE